MTDYPAEPGHCGLGGSPEGAEYVKEFRGRQHVMVLNAIGEAGAYGATGDEIAAKLGWNKYQVRPRTAELRAAGRIMDSRRRRKSESGILVIVWILPEYSEPVSIAKAA